MIKTDSPYKVKKMELSVLSNDKGDTLYCVDGPRIDSEWQGTLPQSLKGMEHENAVRLATMLNTAYKCGQIDRSNEIRKMFRDFVGID
jgi:hypothetical protein